tara:strand:+ start:16 stop:513 length:498 start_codon:yes stop_codon:yes gene_type:complete
MSNLLVQNIKHTNGTTAQTVDSSGRVLEPVKPHILCGMAGNGYVAVANQGVFPFSTVLQNQGGFSVNGSTHKITVPCTGIYLITINVLNETEQNIDVGFFVNDSHKLRFFVSTNRGLNASNTIQLSASDEVHCRNTVSFSDEYYALHTYGLSDYAYTTLSLTFLG